MKRQSTEAWQKKRSNPDGRDDAERKTKKKQKKQIHVRIMTFNVQGYITADTTSKQQEIVQIIEESGADVVALQEDYVPRPFDFGPSYQVVSTCKAQKFRHGHLQNSIVMRLNFRNRKKSTNVIDITSTCPVVRCASIVRLPCSGLILANVHLCGGRYDDPSWRKLRDVKTKQIQALVLKAKPDLLVGDFNGERTPFEAEKTLKKYPLYKAQRNGAKKAFLRYL